MAGKVVKDLSDDFLNCSICIDQFKTPKMLPCIHSFCEECIGKYAKKQTSTEVACPTCRKVCKLPEMGVKGLPTNFHLINLAEKVNFLEKMTSKEKSTSLCDSCKTPEVVAFCVDCNIVICSKCKGHHALFPLLQSHSVISLKQLVDPTFQKEWKIARSPLCTLHPSEKLQFYCKTCSELICRDCTIVLHSKPKHECTEAGSQFNESKEELGVKLENSVNQLDKAMGFIKEGNVGFAALLRSRDLIDIDIANHCNEMIKEIRKVYEKQRQCLLDEISGRIGPVESQLQMAEDWVKRMQTTQEMTRKIIKENNPWELMGMSSDLSSAFDALKDDNSLFQWGKFKLRHQAAFSPGALPEITIGFQYRQADVVVSDRAGNFYLCSFDEFNKEMHACKVTSYNGNVVKAEAYKFQIDVPCGAKLVATCTDSNYTICLLAIGVHTVTLDCVSMKFATNYQFQQQVDTTNTSMKLGSNNLIYNTSTTLVNEENGKMTSKAASTVFSRHPKKSKIFKVSNTHSFSDSSSIDSVFPCSQEIFFYTGNDELKSYNVAVQQYGNIPNTSYDVDPPKTVLTFSQTEILMCLHMGSYTFHTANRHISCFDIAHIFILWKGNVIKAGKTTEEEGWMLKEYNTKDKKVFGELNYVDGKVPRPPAALHCQQTGNGGMQIYLCDDLGNITTYKREPYNQNVVPYEVV